MELLDNEILNLLVSYTILLVAMDRQDETALLRERALRVVRTSEGLRKRETKVMDLFDDEVALFSMREKRRLKRQGGSEEISFTASS